MSTDVIQDAELEEFGPAVDPAAPWEVPADGDADSSTLDAKAPGEQS